MWLFTYPSVDPSVSVKTCEKRNVLSVRSKRKEPKGKYTHAHTRTHPAFGGLRAVRLNWARYAASATRCSAVLNAGQWEPIPFPFRPDAGLDGRHPT